MGKKKKVEIRTDAPARPYVLWRRVSTQEQGESGLGLAAQLTIAKTFMGKDPVEVFTDVYSGTKLMQCAGLWRAIEYCKENGTMLVIAKSDRFRSVQQALEVLDAVGQTNIFFCDLPSSDRFVLTIMFAVAERQAQIGQINTKIALAERKKQIEEQGGFFSKAGRWTTHLGREKGCDNAKANAASAVAATEAALAWREEAAIYGWVKEQIHAGHRFTDIFEGAQRLYKINPKVYCARNGKALSKATLSRWTKEIINTK